MRIMVVCQLFPKFKSFPRKIFKSPISLGTPLNINYFIPLSPYSYLIAPPSMTGTLTLTNIRHSETIPP